METYPRNRCPECREFFRLEIKVPMTHPRAEAFDPSFLICPRCGFRFHRFPVPTPAEKAPQALPQ